MSSVQDRTIKVGNYQFDEKKHAHTLDGKPLMGVTTVLKVIGKGDALVQWSANETVKYIEANFPTFDTLMKDKGALNAMLDNAKTAWRSNRDKAGNFGSNVHNAIERWIKRDKDVLFYTSLDAKETLALDNFIEWAEKNNIKFLECEKHVHSREMWVGGILDLVFEKDGKRYIGDIKTSSGIYPEHFFQMGAYDICLNEMTNEYKDIDGYTIINLKKTGQIEVETNYGREQNREAFKHALALYKILETTKKTV